MADHSWYSTSNDHNQRELTIVNVAQLVGKAPTKEKRIRVKVRMILSDNINMGSPEWLDRAARFVSETHDTVTPSIEFKGYDLHFSAQNLFQQEGVKAPRCQMRSFEIHECGDSEEPDVAVTYTLYCPFSTDLWAWLGQFGGEECWCKFTPGVPTEDKPAGPSDDQPALTAGDDEDEDEEDEEDEEEVREIDEETELDPDNEHGDASDVVLEDALHVFETHGKVSAVELQRVLSISYVNAAHIIDRMESKGMVTKGDVNGVRSLTGSGNVPQKSGPKNLAAYHEEVLEAEAPKKGRGRPRKTPPVDPLTVDTATAF